MRLTFISLLFIPFALFSQQSKEWLEFFNSLEFSSSNRIDVYEHFQFEFLIFPRSDFLGFIGDDFQRIEMIFTSITKADSRFYDVSGMSVVESNVRRFNGTIELTDAREYTNMHFGLDNLTNVNGYKEQGILIGEYKFLEDSSQSKTGIFKGVMTLWWYIDKYGILKYDKIQWYSDSYVNNQYIGKWTSYKSGISKTCNWGEYRIPFSGDLDIGTGEFYINPKYYSKGWEDYNTH